MEEKCKSEFRVRPGGFFALSDFVLYCGSKMERVFLEQFQYLLAGFVAAWVFYGLTPYKRPTPFERVVQALVYNAIAQLLATGLAGAAGFPPGPGGIFILAVFIGVAFAWLTNRDYPHEWLRKIGVTMQTARKCNWADAFDAAGYDFIILNLKDGRRLCGWPYAWPDTHADDHFLLMDYAWLPDQGGGDRDGKVGEVPDLSKITVAKDDAILLAAEAVDTVEFLFNKIIGPPTKGDST